MESILAKIHQSEKGPLVEPGYNVQGWRRKNMGMDTPQCGPYDPGKALGQKHNVVVALHQMSLENFHRGSNASEDLEGPDYPYSPKDIN